MTQSRLPFFILLALLPIVASAQAKPDFSEAEKSINAAIARNELPGAVLLIGRKSGTIYEKAFGRRALLPAPEAMTTDTIFDLASLSKSIGTTTCAMILIDRGKIDPQEKVATYFPEFGKHGKEAITVEHLLLHRGGLIPDNPEKDYLDGPAKAWERICDLELKSKPGEKFAYSDVGFIVLGKLVEKVAGRPLDQFAADEIFKPLGMTDTSYNPPASWKPRCAPTEQRNGQWIRGEVHDPRAFALGGFAGHAGLFSTTADVAKFCRMILNGGEFDGRRILSPHAIELISTGRPYPDGLIRSYGYDVKTGYSQPLGDRFPPLKSFGHTGFTGTCFWIDPADDVFFILLTNAVHPDGKGKVLALRRAVSTSLATALLGRAPGNVLTGIDVLKKDNFKLLEGKHLAIITNHTGRDRDGNRTVDLLAAAPNCKVVCLFSPEHGLYGAVDEKVGNAVDEKTKLKVYSLYGQTRRPTDDMLVGVDTLLFDIQDIGTRFYTYPATMANCMEEAAKRKLKMIVLDRPNPIGPLPVDGPIADKKYFGFTAFGPLPLVHGMTIGELARLFNTDYAINCDLTVVECQNYNRNMWWDETGLMWTNPSPNMRNLTQATIYPAIGMLETANLSVGRGTDQPFEFIGAPWIDGKKLAAALNAANLPGLRFVPIEFTPTSSKFENKLCQGCYILVTDRTKLEPARTGLTIAYHLKQLFGDAFQIDSIVRLMQNDAVLAGLKTTNDPSKLPGLWQQDLEHFRAVREKYLIYR
ncbi:MAG: hypothetical protein JWN40_3676 [Phycisphaerales bacterium]|nr:hypothetical protein [Phycisphaerales bacterium]